MDQVITIAEPGRNIVKLWCKQTPKTAEKYRQMRYVLRVEHDGKTALQNNVTGQLVLLDDAERELLDSLPADYCEEMDDLIADHFLVPVDYDEHKQVVNLRSVLRRMLVPVNPPITSYTILPTTACNARCYYCFEQGSKIVTMSEQTANDTVKFIADHCGEKKEVFITWFGGEPTVAANRIDQICEGLQAAGISYSSMMYTNGYLLDERMAVKAKSLWHLNHVQMSVDGTEQLYNKIKAYVNVQKSPYQQVMQNIGHMLEHNISVSMRMNVDYVNYQNFNDLMLDCIDRFKGNPDFQFYAYPLIGEYKDHDGVINHADEAWTAAKVEELNRNAKENGLLKVSETLPELTLSACVADNPAAVTIGPDGLLVRCGECFQSKDAVGSLTDGITNNDMVHEWQKITESDQCTECAFFPNCIQLSKCSGAGHCYRQGRKQQIIWGIQNRIDQVSREEGNCNAV